MFSDAPKFMGKTCYEAGDDYQKLSLWSMLTPRKTNNFLTLLGKECWGIFIVRIFNRQVMSFVDSLIFNAIEKYFFLRFRSTLEQHPDDSLDRIGICLSQSRSGFSVFDSALETFSNMQQRFSQTHTHTLALLIWQASWKIAISNLRVLFVPHRLVCVSRMTSAAHQNKWKILKDSLDRQHWITLIFYSFQKSISS